MSSSILGRLLAKRQHIQDHSAATNVTLHWGYPSRVVPCTNDAGSCEYLDGVYWMHDVSMLYTFIMWAVIGALLAIFIFLRIIAPSARKRNLAETESEERIETGDSAFYRAWRGTQAWLRRWLLPESLVQVFGRVTRLQILTLAIISGYLLIFSLVGIVYKKWVTPVKNKPGVFNTRTGLGGFSDRVGALAYALTPLTVALGSRESILTLFTGIPYQSFNFLHRWTGRIIFAQSVLHTIGWCVIEAKLYQPQPTVWRTFIKQLYMIWGVIAMVLLLLLFVLSLTPVIKRTGHEFFRKTHYILAMIYIGACWGHWNKLYCWMLASLVVWGLDRGVRLLRTLLIHTRNIDGSTGFNFRTSQSSVQYFDDPDGGVVRLSFSQNFETWAPGQHFFLCFPALTIWQSHPLTTLSLPTLHTVPEHTYIVRCRKGETGRLKNLALSTTTPEKSNSNTITPVILCGPYGTDLLPSKVDTTNILAIAGGTGVSLTLPVVMAATATPAHSRAAIDFVWMIRRASNVQWIAPELEELKRRARLPESNIRIHIFVTQEHSSSSSAPPTPIEYSAKTSLDIGVAPISGSGAGSSISTSSVENETRAGSMAGENFRMTFMDDHHPSLRDVVENFMETRAKGECRTRVIASGPRGMGGDLREAVARMNDGGRVWKGERRWDVSLDWDDRG